MDGHNSAKGSKMSFLYALQIIGGCIMVIGYFPQIRQILKTRSVRDLNIKTFISITIGIAMMETYAIGLVIHDHTGGAFLITNSLALAVNVLVVGLIAFFSKPEAVDQPDLAADEPVT